MKHLPSWTVTIAGVLVWSIALVFLVLWALSTASAVAAVFASATAILWAAGMRSLTVWARSCAVPVRRLSSAAHIREDSAISSNGLVAPRVALLYCVADDVSFPALRAGAAQRPDADVVILDDSRDAGARRRIDAFAAEMGCRVVRRDVRTGFKAGNLNHALAVLRGTYDAYVVCDADVLLPAGFVRRSVAALADPRVAIAQALPTADTGPTRFARYFGPLLHSHLAVARRDRDRRGVPIFLGRGALVRAAALEDVGGFPEVVAEDLALTVALRRRGWRVIDLDDSFREDYPVDYRAFRTQMRKTAEGAVEFLRGHAGRPRRRGGAGLDLVSEAAIIPTTAVAGAVTLVTGPAVAALGVTPPLWILALSMIAGVAPLLPETLRRARVIRPAAGAAFLLVGGVLYASTLFTVLGAVMRTGCGVKAVFWITPKEHGILGFRAGWRVLRADLVWAAVIALTASLIAGTAIAAVTVVGPVIGAIAFLCLRSGTPLITVPPSPSPRGVGRTIEAVGR